MQTTFAPKIALTKDTNAHYDAETQTLEVGQGKGITTSLPDIEAHEKVASDAEQVGREAVKNHGGVDNSSTAKKNLNARDRSTNNTPIGPWNIGGVVSHMVRGGDESQAPRPELGEAYKVLTDALLRGEEATPEQLKAFAAEIAIHIRPRLFWTRNFTTQRGVKTCVAAGMSSFRNFFLSLKTRSNAAAFSSAMKNW